MTGLSVGRYLWTFDRTNLCPASDAVTREAARAAASALRPLLGGRRVLLLGKTAARAFGLEREEPFRWLGLELGRGPAACCAARARCRVALAPHPSGRCRWYNEPANAARARAFLERLARGEE